MPARATLAVGCILKWALVKEDDVSCPKCKAKFSSLYTYRSLDGTLHDFPQVWRRVVMGQFVLLRACVCVCVCACAMAPSCAVFSTKPRLVLR